MIKLSRPLWKGLGHGGAIEQCGWLRDRYGVSWQIVPRALGEMMKDPIARRPAVRRRRCSA